MLEVALVLLSEHEFLRKGFAPVMKYYKSFEEGFSPVMKSLSKGFAVVRYAVLRAFEMGFLWFSGTTSL